MTTLPTLREVITPEAIQECYEQVERHLDKRVVHIYDNMRWPGKQKNVCRWWELEGGSAVAWNENLSKGWTFPSMKLPKAFMVTLNKDAGERLQIANVLPCTYQEWIGATESATLTNLASGISMIYSAAKQMVFLRVSKTAPKSKLNADMARSMAEHWLRSHNL